MDTTAFLLCLACAIAAPVLSIAYLRGILMRVLNGLCDADGSAEFWIRCATLLATTGSVLLLTLFGDFEPGTPLSSALRRALLLTMASVFASVAIISRNVWTQVQPMLPTTPAAIGAAAVRPRQ
jgi:hypothetical protein